MISHESFVFTFLTFSLSLWGKSLTKVSLSHLQLPVFEGRTEKRWEKLRWHEKRWGQLRAVERAEKRRGDMRWGEIRWDEMRRRTLTYTHDRRWDEMGWDGMRCDDTDAGDNRMQWEMFKRSWDTMKSDEMREDPAMKGDGTGMTSQHILLWNAERLVRSL